MSKKHFEAMAAEIRNMRAEKVEFPDRANELEQRALGAERLAILMGRQFNARFDISRFLDACLP